MFYRDRLVLVTGGTGFVGTHIVQELLKSGARVRVPIHKRPMTIKDKRIELMRADLAKQADCLKVLSGVDYCFHAAGVVAGSGAVAANPMSAITVNLVLTSQMLQAACDIGVERFLLFSSSTGYPVADYPIKEEEMWNGSPYEGYFGYGWMRRYLERLGEFVALKSKVKIAIVRPTAIYGRWDNFDPKASHVIPALIRRAVEKQDPYEVWGTGEEVRDFLHVSDLALACLLMLEKNAECDPVNIGYGEAVKVKDVVRIILRACGHEKARLIFNSSKPTTIPFRMVDISKAKKLLGFRPKISLNDGIEDTVRWYKESKNKFKFN
ncbi:MAG: NAD-dependent epimerase/dehydratase family protein [Candidatus Omnitrophota bacterium]|nr:NAD-dependent epimerase/dehydratase family protein [Candidatus Omnitrophota bacterium]